MNTKKKLRKKRRPQLLAQARERIERQRELARRKAENAWRRRFLND